MTTARRSMNQPVRRRAHFVARLVEHYNTARLHSALGYITPADFLAGRSAAIWAARDHTLEAARETRRARRAEHQDQAAARSSRPPASVSGTFDQRRLVHAEPVHPLRARGGAQGQVDVSPHIAPVTQICLTRTLVRSPVVVWCCHRRGADLVTSLTATQEKRTPQRPKRRKTCSPEEPRPPLFARSRWSGETV